VFTALTHVTKGVQVFLLPKLVPSSLVFYIPINVTTMSG
jgi:hypothetical protein